MCGRYVLFSDAEAQDIRDIIDEVNRKVNGEVKTGEIFPTDFAPVLTQHEVKLELELVKWGYPSFKGKGVIINARSETVAEKPMFRNSIVSKRCIIPSTGFFEWSHDGKKQKYLFHLPETKSLYMAGLYSEFNGQRCFVVLTTEANQSMADIHSRMPVVLTPPEMTLWLTNTKAAVNILCSERPALQKILA
ncbi:MAG TPA: SOS response-associated peptidase [Oscillospiraceae bacterium]|nr:SOS response-associated peptidase [Oscillospiraceae bacterium]